MCMCMCTPLPSLQLFIVKAYFAHYPDFVHSQQEMSRKLYDDEKNVVIFISSAVSCGQGLTELKYRGLFCTKQYSGIFFNYLRTFKVLASICSESKEFYSLDVLNVKHHFLVPCSEVILFTVLDLFLYRLIQNNSFIIFLL